MTLASAAVLLIVFDHRRANLATQGRPFSAQREHGTLLSQPVFEFAQLIQAIGARPATVAVPSWEGCTESLNS